MRRDLAVYLVDLQQCLEELVIFSAGKQLGDYRNDVLLRRAIERDFTVVGEIMRRILHHFPETQRIDHAQSIANFRNVIVHEYDVLDDVQIWNIVSQSAPILKQQVDDWIAELDRSSHT